MRTVYYILMTTEHWRKPDNGYIR